MGGRPIPGIEYAAIGAKNTGSSNSVPTSEDDTDWDSRGGPEGVLAQARGLR